MGPCCSSASLYSVFAALVVLASGLAKDIGLKETQFGFLLASAGVGLIIGAGFLGQWGDRVKRLPLSLLGFCSMGVMLIGFSFVHQLWAALVLSVLLGLGAALIGVPMQTLIQVETPADMRGKVFGLQNNVINIALSLPLAIAGLLADAIGLRIVLTGPRQSCYGASGAWSWRKMPNHQSRYCPVKLSHFSLTIHSQHRLFNIQGKNLKLFPAHENQLVR